MLVQPTHGSNLRFTTSSVLMRKGGGHRKRVQAYEAAQQAASESSQRGSRLGKLLAEQYCWGFLSAIAVQQFAAAAVADGASHDDLKRTQGSRNGWMLCLGLPKRCSSTLFLKLVSEAFLKSPGISKMNSG